jgi:serine-type D-Ala-D-Ala carboxypeptidase (penicillin-binding protein 5/6)
MPEHYDLPIDYDEEKEMRRAEEFLLNEKINTALKAFYRVMNTTAAAVGMKKSNFAVAHGMHHNDNYSTAHEIALLARVALQQHSLLNTVVNTKHYQVASRVSQGHVYKWVNTNNMLWDTSGRGGQSAYFGVKTGITPTAGPCLCVNFRSPCGFDFIVVVLNCKSREARFVEIPKLCQWAINKILRVRRTNLRPGVKKRLLRNMAHV